MLTNDSRPGGAKAGMSCRDHACGRCSYGDKCRFSHAAPIAPPLGNKENTRAEENSRGTEENSRA